MEYTGGLVVHMPEVAGKSKTTNGAKVTGTEYVYFDANTPTNGKLTLSPHHVNTDGALPNTLKQLYGMQGASTQQLGWSFYNDEDPITPKTNGSRRATPRARPRLRSRDFSTPPSGSCNPRPNFRPRATTASPSTGMPNAQTLLCVTLQDATVAQSLAKQMARPWQPQRLSRLENSRGPGRRLQRPRCPC